MYNGPSVSSFVSVIVVSQVVVELAFFLLATSALGVVENGLIDDFKARSYTSALCSGPSSEHCNTVPIS